MNVKSALAVCFLCFLCLTCSSPVIAKDFLDLDKYSCSEFIADAERPTSPEKILRSMMMISWAVGYASGHQTKIVRADSGAIKLMSATLGKACRIAPAKRVTDAIVYTIEKFDEKLERE